MMRAPQIVHVEYFLIKRPTEILEQLAADMRVDANGCHIVPYKALCGVMRGFGATDGISLTRIVYAIAHPTEVIRKTDIIVHICEHGTQDHSNDCCIHPEHIVRSDTRKDVQVMRRVREAKMFKPRSQGV